LHYGAMKRRDRAIKEEIKSCKKIVCKSTDQDNEYLCDYFLELSISNLIEPYEHGFYKDNNGNKQGRFIEIKNGFEFIPIQKSHKK